jgi:hypothetical protein
LHMLDLACYSERNANFIEPDTLEKSLSDGQVGVSSLIYYKPNEVKVQYYDKWKNLKIEREDVQKIDPLADWTFSSSYMGTLSRLNQHKLYSMNPNLFPASEKEKIENITKPIEIKIAEGEELPVNRLGQDNPILKFMEVHLYDDELCDNGHSQGNFR